MKTLQRVPDEVAPPDALLLDTSDLAKLLHVSTKTVTRLAARGELPPPIKVGRLTRWSRRTIEAWIAAKQKETEEGD